MRKRNDTGEFMGMWRKYECATCGKTFYCDDQTIWTYKLTTNVKRQYKRQMFCSYTCLRIAQKKKEENRKRKGRK